MIDPATIVRPHIPELTPYSSAREEFSGKAKIWLDANENPYGHGLNRYPGSEKEQLRQDIAAEYERPTNNVFLGHGSDEAIDLLLRIFGRPGEDQVIICPPTYGVYGVMAKSHNLEVMDAQTDERFQPDPSAIGKLWSNGAKLLFLCSPNNPTGNTVDFGILRNILDKAQGMVVVDEAYQEFADTPSALELLDEYPNLVVLRTFSKAWGCAGIRFGMAFADERIIDWMETVSAPYNISTLTIKAAQERLTHQEAVKRTVNTLKQQRKMLADELTGLKCVEKVFPSQANFLLVRFRNAKQIYSHLAEHGIIVRDRSHLPGCDNCLRITVGTKDENQTLMKALREFEATTKT